MNIRRYMYNWLELRVQKARDSSFHRLSLQEPYSQVTTAENHVPFSIQIVT